MFGLIMGFKNYDIVTGVKGIFTSEWVGLKYFKEIKYTIPEGTTKIGYKGRKNESHLHC